MKTLMNRMEVKKQPKMMKRMKYRYMYWLDSYSGCNSTCRHIHIHKPEWLLVSVSVPAPLAIMGLANISSSASTRKCTDLSGVHS